MYALIFYSIVVALCVGISTLVRSCTCSAKWEDSGMRSEYGFITGCRVEVEKGKWIPEERYREVDQ